MTSPAASLTATKSGMLTAGSHSRGAVFESVSVTLAAVPARVTAIVVFAVSACDKFAVASTEPVPLLPLNVLIRNVFAPVFAGTATLQVRGFVPLGGVHPATVGPRLCTTALAPLAE